MMETNGLHFRCCNRTRTEPPKHDLQKVADAFFKLGLIPKAVQVADIVWAAPAVRLAAAKL